MKNLMIKTLCLSLSFQLSFGSIALAQEKTAPAEFLKAVQEEGEALFGKDGPAFYDEKSGKIYIKHNSTTSAALQDDANKPNSLNTIERIKAFLPRAEKAQKIYASFNEKAKESYNKTCVNCGETRYADPAMEAAMRERDQIPEGGLCTANEKKKIADEFKKPSCKLGSLSGSCLEDFAKSLAGSLGTMTQSIWNAGIGLGKDSAKKKLFESFKPAETAATNTGLLMSGMSEKQRELARKNIAKANDEIESNLNIGLSWLGQWILNLDVPMYKELWSCAKCGEKTGAICKIAGVVGKDVVQNMIMMYLMGQGMKAIAKYGGRFAKSSAGNALTTRFAASAVGRVAIPWGEQIASTSVKAMNGYKAFVEKTYAGKAVDAFAKFGIKIVNLNDDIGNAIINKAGRLPSVIGIKGGKKVATEIAEQGERAATFAKTSILDEADIAKKGIPGVSTLDGAASTSTTLAVEVPRPVTPATQQAKDTVAKMKVKNVDLADDIENATLAKIEIPNGKSIKVKTADGIRYVQVNHSWKPTEFYPYGKNSENGILKVGDDFYLTHKGKIVRKAEGHQKNALKTLTSEAERAKANQIAVQNAKENVTSSGGKVVEENASKLDNGGFKTETPQGCEPGTVTIKAL